MLLFFFQGEGGQEVVVFSFDSIFVFLIVVLVFEVVRAQADARRLRSLLGVPGRQPLASVRCDGLGRRREGIPRLQEEPRHVRRPRRQERPVAVSGRFPQQQADRTSILHFLPLIRV